MTSVRTVIIVGGGTAGCALAALLGRAGVAVEIVERKPDFTTYGSGITLQGAALRVLRQVGVWDDLRRHGFEFNDLGLRSADGRLLAELPDARTGGPDLPATLGAYRPKLAELLAEAAVGAGAKVRLGETVESITQDANGVDVTFSDGDTGRYDLLVGADGIRSRTRAQLGIDVQPQPVGMGIWRVHARRPEEVVRTDLIYDGPCYIAGYCPTSPDTLYAYLVEDARDRSAETPEQKVGAMRELAESYHGPWDAIRDDITDADRINYALFEHLLIEGPWNRGRAILIGDAAHACPPTVALGAAMALEDSAVLAEVLLAHDELNQDVFDEFVHRRMPRARAVVDASLQLSTWLLERKRDADVPGLMGRVFGLISQPA
jgi:2-polyprenyl-6-methoxyphenol hydroxylase-like FAD-dependent oxidoreductase